MTRATFFQHFELLADTPDAVAKMRELVLQLAIRGELVSQSASDESPVSLFPAKLSLEAVTDEPYSLPVNWIWVRLAQLAELIRGVSYKKHEACTIQEPGLVPVLRANSIGDGLNFDDLVFVPKANVREEQYIRRNDVLIAMSSGSKNLVGKAAQAESDYEGAFGTFCGLLRLTVKIHPQYFGLFLKTPYYRERIAEAGKGIGINNLQRGSLESLPVPLPPLAEQKRIVAKVEELLGLCDELAARQQAQRAARARLTQSAFTHLTAASDELSFRKHSTFVLHNSSLILEDVIHLRQTILQLAVQGRLVRQDPKDEPVAALLTKIRTENQHSETERRRKQVEVIPNLTAEELLFDVPQGWEWTRFHEIATILANLVEPASFGKYPHVAPDNIEKGTGRLLPYRTVAEDEVRSGNHRFFPGQIVYSKIRPNLAKVTVVDFEGLCSADMYPITAHINTRYLLLYMLSAPFLSVAVKNDTRVAMPKINQDELNRIPVPVPPLAEQKRIVAKVGELLRLCDELETRLQQSRTHGEQLLAATLRQLLAG